MNTDPVGPTRFCWLSARLTSFGVKPCAASRPGSRSATMTRGLPPYGVGSSAPCTGASACRTVNCAKSNISASLLVGLPSATCMIGTLDGSYARMIGGVVPTGIRFSTVWEVAVTCATAWSMRTVGWK